MSSNKSTTAAKTHAPGIGAVVAMVAAANMAFGGWRRRRERAALHWDWAPVRMTHRIIPACGAMIDEDDVFCEVADTIAEVDCPACLAMYRRVYGKGEV